MSLRNAATGNKSVRKMLRVDEIRINPLNKWNMSNIEQLAYSIKVNGLLEPIVVYEDFQNDGKKYTLLSGHRRYTAMLMLQENNEVNGLIESIVKPKPDAPNEEEVIDHYNAQQRKMTSEEIEDSIIRAIKRWNRMVKENKKPLLKDGEQPRDWLGYEVGLSGRQVSRYLEKIKKKMDRNSSTFEDTEVQTDILDENIKVEKDNFKKTLKSTMVKINKFHSHLCSINNTFAEVDEEIKEIEELQTKMNSIIERLLEKTNV